MYRKIFDKIVIVKNISNIIGIKDPVEPDESLEEDDKFLNKMCVKPSQVNTILSDTIFKCDKCYFEAATKLIMSDRKQLKHNWCFFCY